MIRKLLIRDLTLRDGQQSAFATRMSQKQIDKVLPFYREAGFYAMEIWGGAVPDSIMRYLGEDPWERLEKIKASVGNTSKLTALSRGRNLFGYNPYPDKIIKGFCRNSIESGLDIMRIFDALNDVENIKSTVKYVKRFGGMADCAVCYTIDPYHSAVERIVAALHGHPLHKPVFTNEYFLDKALQMEALGADMITIKDMSGLIPPGRSAEIVRQDMVWLRFWPLLSTGWMLSIPISGISLVERLLRQSNWCTCSVRKWGSSWISIWRRSRKSMLICWISAKSCLFSIWQNNYLSHLTL